MIDLHAHVLPGIDDGPANTEQSLALLRAAAFAGTRVIAATPHLRRDFPRVRVADIGHSCMLLQEQVPDEWELEVVSGGELDLGWAMRASDDQLLLASYAGRGTDLLVETPYATSCSRRSELCCRPRLRSGWASTTRYPRSISRISGGSKTLGDTPLAGCSG